MYFLAFGLDAHDASNAHFFAEEGDSSAENVEQRAWSLWSNLSDGGYQGFVLITDDMDNILAAVRTGVPRFEILDDWHLTT